MSTVPPEQAPKAPAAAAGQVPQGVQAAGERIERLLEASASAGPLARARAEELVRVVVDLYGAGLERLLGIAFAAGALSDSLLEALCDDELVSSLLLVHDLHPYPVEERIARALDKVRPYLGSHGGDVELLEVTGEGVARLRLLGSCDGCPSSSVTVSLAVEGAVMAAAPEVVSIELMETPTASPAAAVIPVDALSVRLREPASGRPSWEPAGRVEELAAGQVHPVSVGGQHVVLARIGPDVYAYRDSCPGCGQPLAGATLERRLGGPATVVLTCPRCRTHYDVRRAGVGLGGAQLHLEPLPLLLRDGAIEVAVASEPARPVPV